MSITTPWLIHVGPLRSESKAVIKSERLPTLILNPLKEEEEGNHALVHAQREHINTLIAPQAGEATHYHYNLPGFASLMPATGLKALYPGLRETHSQPVETQTLFSVLSEHGEPTIAHLVLEQPEQALELLTAWQAEGLLEQLNTLYVRTSPESLYEGMPNQAELTAWCERYGFESHRFEPGETNAEDPEFPLLSFKRNALYVPLKAAHEEAEALKAKLNEYERLLKENAQQLSRAANALRATDAERNTLQQAHEALAQELKQEHDTLKQQLEQARATAKSEATKQAQAQEETAKLKQEHGTLKQERDQAQQALTETQEKLEQTHTWFIKRKQQAEEGAEKLKKLEAERDALKAENNERAQQQETLAKELEQARATAKSEATKQAQALEAAKQQIAALTQQLASKENSLHNTEERFSSLESKLAQLFGEQRSYIQQTTNALGQHVTRSAQQQRDEQALTHYLQHGQRPVSTQLAPGYAMALLEQRDTQRYDVMVVLGSPAATELLAQAVMNEQGSQQPRLTAQSQAKNGNDVQQFVTPSQDDLPQAIVSLGHKKSLCKALKQRLAANHSQEAVSVVHAPWVEASKKGDLFYAWEATLKRLNQWLEEDAKVLVVIGNALAEANHPRTAALPQLLQHLPTQTLDVIVEGNHYPQESELKAEWEALLNKRQRDVQWLTMPAALSLRIEG